MVNTKAKPYSDGAEADRRTKLYKLPLLCQNLVFLKKILCILPTDLTWYK